MAIKKTDEVTPEQAKELFRAALQRLYAAYHRDEEAATANGQRASDQELRRTLGMRKSKEQAKQLHVVFEAVDLVPEQHHVSPAAPANKSEKDTGRMQDADVLASDLGIIADEQRTSQEYIAALSTLHSYAKVMRDNTVARHLHRMMNDTKQLEETITKLASRLVKQSAAQQAASAMEAQGATS